MALADESITALEAAIAEGTFPDSEQFLTASLDVRSIPSLRQAISQSKAALSNELREISKEQAGNVDAWIVQAKQVQDDIARCKLEARQIVEEHERVEALRDRVRDTKTKVQLLEDEISFSQSVQHELESVSEISQVLEEANQDILAQRPINCIHKLVSIQTSIQRISRGASRTLLEQLDKDLRQKATSQLCGFLDNVWTATRDKEHVHLGIAKGESSSDAFMHVFSLEDGLSALSQIGSLSDGLSLMLTKAEKVLLPLYSRRLGLYPVSTRTVGEQIDLQISPSPPTTSVFLDVLQQVFTFLHTALPKSIEGDFTKAFVPKIISLVIEKWLDNAIPYELSELQNLKTLTSDVTKIEAQLAEFTWPGGEELRDWNDQIPRNWLNKRRATSLDAVRTAMRSASGNTRQVERIERQFLQKDDVVQSDEADWNVAWDDEPIAGDSKSTNAQEDDDEDAWGFETEDTIADAKLETKAADDDEDDAGEAWGWADDTPVDETKPHISTKETTNGKRHHLPVQEEVVLKELYTITDIPDYILEVIGRDLSDAHDLKSIHDDSIFNSSAPASALQALPTLILAMFRATAPTHYSHTRNLSSMNLYNDTLYVTEKVTEATTSDAKLFIQPALDAMTKFARQVYTRELDTQRTILSDLLDGAQGFVSCNSTQYRELSASAVSAVVDRIRQLQHEYRDVLGQSHLLQTIGSLVAMVIGKVISDIEDLEDISEKESERLVEYCQQISALENLFTVPKPQEVSTFAGGATDSQEAQQVSTIALYVPNYFRFQYLTEVLLSSLADIKFMWTEGGLRSDFSADEVVDLITALFSESSHRRSAISAIRGSA